MSEFVAKHCVTFTAGEQRVTLYAGAKLPAEASAEDVVSLLKAGAIEEKVAKRAAPAEAPKKAEKPPTE